MKRAVVFAHFDPQNQIDPYVFFYLEQLKTICHTLVFVTTSVVNDIDKKKIEACNFKLVQRENLGYDFMSYKTGLKSLNLMDFDEIILCNDSVYGPFYPLSTIINKMSESQCDFWGITQSIEIRKHVQSYFICFRQPVFTSKVFEEFWKNVTILDSKDDIIQKYEIGISQKFYDADFLSTTYVKFESTPKSTIALLISKFFQNPLKLILFFRKPMQYINFIFSKKHNSTLVFWFEILKNNSMPFLKTAHLKASKEQSKDLKILEEYLQKQSSYPIGLIKDHLIRVGK